MLCKYCAKLNTGSRCLFCGNKLRTLTPAELEAEREKIAAREEVAVADAPAAAAPVAADLPKKQNGFSIAGFVLALLGTTFVLGLIFSIIGLVQSKNLNGSGKKLAVAGIVLSAIYMAYVIFMYVFIFSRRIM